MFPKMVNQKLEVSGKHNPNSNRSEMHKPFSLSVNILFKKIKEMLRLR